MYSSQLPDLAFTTDNDVLAISICDRKDFTELYCSSIYTYNGKILLYGVRDIVEQFMRTNGMTYMQVMVEAENDSGEDVLSIVMDVLFASFTPNIPAPQFARQNFLTTLTAKVMDRQTTETLYAYVESGEDVSLKLEIISQDWDDNIVHTVVKTDSTAAGTKIASIDMSYTDMYDRAGREACKAVLSARLKYGERVFMCYFEDDVKDVRFSFRNAFNVWEKLCVEGATKVKTSMEKSEAVAVGRIVHYNRRSSQTYEVKLAPLRTEEAVWMAQFLLSHHIYKDAETEDDKILIDDFSHEVTDDDDQQHKVEFTWQYADKNKLPLSLPTEHNPDMFANEFTEPFE